MGTTVAGQTTTTGVPSLTTSLKSSTAAASTTTSTVASDALPTLTAVSTASPPVSIPNTSMTDCPGCIGQPSTTKQDEAPLPIQAGSTTSSSPSAASPTTSQVSP